MPNFARLNLASIFKATCKESKKIMPKSRLAKAFLEELPDPAKCPSVYDTWRVEEVQGDCSERIYKAGREQVQHIINSHNLQPSKYGIKL